MRDYGKVHSSFWTSSTIAAMSDDGKMLSLYLLTCSHSTIAGAFRLPDGYVSEDLAWTTERVAQGFVELFAKGFAYRCETTKWVWVVKHLDWNKPENPNQRKAAAKIALSIPCQCAWKADFMRVCGELVGLDPPDDPNPCETVEEPFLNQKQELKQDIPPSPGRRSNRKTVIPEGFGVSDRVREYAAKHGYGHLDDRLEHFLGYCRANGKTYVDWDQAFENAIRDDWAKLNGRARPNTAQPWVGAK